MNRRDFLQISFSGLAFSFFPLAGFTKIKGSLPNVLILGDSISIGYFPFVQELLKGKAEVTRPFRDNGKPENCQGTTNGIAQVDRWIGDTKWDVIHYNFGLHDLKHVDPETRKNSINLDDPHQADTKQYKKNLQVITDKLVATGAKLIFATTTPYPDQLDNQIRKPGMFKKYNKTALKVMKKNDIEINDLYSFVLPQMEKLMLPNNVHFTKEGSRILGEQVAKCVLNQL